MKNKKNDKSLYSTQECINELPLCDSSHTISPFRSLLRLDVMRMKEMERKEVFHAWYWAFGTFSNESNFEGSACSSQKLLSERCCGLWNIIERIRMRLVEQPEDLGIANKEILALLRNALNHKDYEQWKHEESEPVIRIVHGLCLASYTETNMLPVFQKIGNLLRKQQDAKSAICPLHKRAKRLRYFGVLSGLVSKMFSLEYVYLYFPYLLHSLSSYYFIGWMCRLFGMKYDPRGCENNAGFGYDTVLEGVPIRTIYTPSPTIGDEISPEFRGALQAIRNRKKMTQEELLKEPLPYVMWHYTNLQSLSSRNESKRACAIMHLNREFSDVFCGVTLDVNSHFYRANISGDSEEAVQRVIRDTCSLDEDYMLTQLKQIQDNLSKEYFFPVDDQARTHWSRECETVVRNAFALVCLKQRPEELEQEVWNWYHKAAFRELVLLGVLVWWQKKSASRVVGSSGKMIASNVCKENIDRGARVNACYLWAFGGAEEDVLSCLHARALLTEKSRLILSDRLEPFYAVTMVVTQEEVKDFLKNNVRD